jgi:hypothetical protein
MFSCIVISRQVLFAKKVVMFQIKLVPDTTHCIETVARNEYEKLLRSVMREGRVDPHLSARMELLRTFLQNADFRSLRRQSDEYILAGGRITFIIRQTENGFSYKIAPDE